MEWNGMKVTTTFPTAASNSNGKSYPRSFSTWFRFDLTSVPSTPLHFLSPSLLLDCGRCGYGFSWYEKAFPFHVPTWNLSHLIIPSQILFPMLTRSGGKASLEHSHHHFETNPTKIQSSIPHLPSQTIPSKLQGKYIDWSGSGLCWKEQRNLMVITAPLCSTPFSYFLFGAKWTEAKKEDETSQIM